MRKDASPSGARIVLYRLRYRFLGLMVAGAARSARSDDANCPLPRRSRCDPLAALEPRKNRRITAPGGCKSSYPFFTPRPSSQHTTHQSHYPCPWFSCCQNRTPSGASCLT